MPGSEERGGLGHQSARAADDGEAESALFLGHIDSANAVSKAQSAIHDKLRVRRPVMRYQRYPLRPTSHAREPTPRTRSLLFMTLAVAAASGNDASEVLVPENGFASINPPDDHERIERPALRQLAVAPAFQCARCGPRSPLPVNRHGPRMGFA
jgi:hypothetical protein